MVKNRHDVVCVIMLIDHGGQVVDYEVNQVQKRIWFPFKEILVISYLSLILLYLFQPKYSIHVPHALDQVFRFLKVDCKVFGKQ